MDPNRIQAQHFRQIQMTKYAFIYTLNVPVANNTTLPALLTIEEDADFIVHSFTGSCYGPCDVNGARQTGVATIFPLAGTTTGYADRGVTAKLTDTGAGRTLTSGFVPLEAILSPGYGMSPSLQTLFPFKYTIRRNSKIQFDLRNRDTTANYFHWVSICLQGEKSTV